MVLELLQELLGLLFIHFDANHDCRCSSVPVVVQNSQIGVHLSLSIAKALDAIRIGCDLAFEDGLGALVHPLKDNLVAQIQHARVVDRHYRTF